MHAHPVMPAVTPLPPPIGIQPPPDPQDCPNCPQVVSTSLSLQACPQQGVRITKPRTLRLTHPGWVLQKAPAIVLSSLHHQLLPSLTNRQKGTRRRCPHQKREGRIFSIWRRLAWGSLHPLSRRPRPCLCLLRRQKVVGQLNQCRQKGREWKVGRHRGLGPVLQLTAPRRLPKHAPPPAPQMLRLWKARSWCPNLPLSRNSLRPHPCTSMVPGQRNSRACTSQQNTPPSWMASNPAFTLAFLSFVTPLLPLITHLFYTYLMYIMLPFTTNLLWANMSALYACSTGD